MKVLIANRGEVVNRIARTLARMNIRSVAVYSPSDRALPYTRDTDEAYPWFCDDINATYMNPGALIAMAKSVGATAIHPGYGFLSESAAFARNCQTAGLLWIGPTPAAIAQMADKSISASLCDHLGIPAPRRLVLAPHDDITAALTASLSQPLLVKSPLGGGGKGMRRFATWEALSAARNDCHRHFAALFGSPDMQIESDIRDSRHIEVQVICDRHGNIHSLTPRECSVQRRFQKVIEETPALHLSATLLQKLHNAAQALVRAVAYDSIGTLEFLVTPSQEFYFLEMNTRLQVEHGVTELLYDIDLVELQVRAAQGNAITGPFIAVSRHALECRLYAENEHFLPSAGRLERFFLPSWPDVRAELSYTEGNTVSPLYDPLVGKFLFSRSSRDAAIDQAIAYFKASVFYPLTTNVPYLIAILTHPDFRGGTVTTDWLEKQSAALQTQFPQSRFPRETRPDAATPAPEFPCDAGDHIIYAPMTGKLQSWTTAPGQRLAKDDTVAFIESMKMEHAVTVPAAAVVKHLLVTAGSSVQQGEGLLVLTF